MNATNDVLRRLSAEFGQSPWVDNLKRGYLADGTLAGLVTRGIRGVTSNPTIFQKAIAGSNDYDTQFRELVRAGSSTEDSYWALVVDDVRGACGVLRPVYDSSGGADGFVSLEVSPALADNTAGTIAAARTLHERLAQPNLMVKIPATPAGVPAIQAMIAEGRDINVTLIFSLTRYDEVIEAYISGLEQCEDARIPGVASVASFFISRVDTEVDRRLDAIGSPEANALKGKAAVAQGTLAYNLFRRRFSGPRWAALAAKQAAVQRPLWASTSTKNPSFPDTLYVDTLIGPDTVNTLPEATIEAFADHGTLTRTVDTPLAVADAVDVMRRLAAVGIDMEDVAATLESEGVAAFVKSFDELLATLEARAHELRA